MTEILVNSRAQSLLRRPRRLRLGFHGVGWIGRSRMEAIARSGLAEVTAVCDPSPDAVRESRALAPLAETATCLDALLGAGLDGVVIATPSAQHAGESIRALQRQVPVFCQKPLGRTADEVRRIVATARRADRLLGVDLAYRFTAALQAVHKLVSSGALGEIFAASLLFHNAYGPDKDWFYDRSLSGGGCVIDLGIHLVDAALWVLGFPGIAGVHSRLYSQGRKLDPGAAPVEDYATARLDLASGVTVDLACSWRLPAGQDCIISAEFFGTRGGASFRNVNGSFYDFVAEHFQGTRRNRLVSPPDSWPGRALVEWTRRLQAGNRFAVDNEQFIRVAEALDAIYAA